MNNQSLEIIALAIVWRANCVTTVARRQQLIVDALISVRKQVELESNNAFDEDDADLDQVNFDPDECDDIAFPLATSSSVTATSIVMSDTSITVHVESSAVSSSSSNLESFATIPTRFTEEESQLLLQCTNDATYLANPTTRITKGIKLVRKARIKWNKIVAVFKAKKDNITIFERDKKRLENYCKETRKRQREYDAELKENPISSVETDIIEVAVFANQEVEYYDHENEKTNQEVDINNDVPLIPIAHASAVQEDDAGDHQIDKTNNEVHSSNEIPLVLNPNIENVVQVGVANIALTAPKRKKIEEGLTTLESAFVRTVGKNLMREGKFVRASDLLLAYNSRQPGFTRDEIQLKNSWNNFKDSKEYKTFRDSIKL